MNTLKFKTNIKCAGCVAKVTPFLDKAAGENNWKVDIHTTEKVLTVVSETTSPNDIITSLQEAGYTAEPVQ